MKVMPDAIPTALYRHFDNDKRLLYVGISLNVLARQAQHRKVSPWFDEVVEIRVERFDSREEAKHAERCAIEEEQPLHNSHHKNTARVVSIQAARSRDVMLQRLVEFKPIYVGQEVADMLHMTLKKLVDEIELGRCGGYWQDPTTFKAHQRYPKLFITGWDVIDYIELLSAEGLVNEQDLPGGRMFGTRA